MKCKTYRNWFTSEKIKVVIFSEQVDVLLIGFKSLTTHDEIAPKIFACKNNKQKYNKDCTVPVVQEVQNIID